jgi:hypothetical protein
MLHTGTCLEGPTCSNTDECGWWEETSDRVPGCGGDPYGVSGGVLALLGGGLPSIEGERECLVSLLSSIASKRGQQE